MTPGDPLAVITLTLHEGEKPGNYHAIASCRKPGQHHRLTVSTASRDGAWQALTTAIWGLELPGLGLHDDDDRDADRAPDPPYYPTDPQLGT